MSGLDDAAELVRSGKSDDEIRSHLMQHGMSADDAAGAIRRIRATAVTPERAKADGRAHTGRNIVGGLAFMGVGAWNLTHGTSPSGDMGLALFGLLMIPVGFVFLIVGIVQWVRSRAAG